ncbi:MAG: alpha/beta fold hydrolase [Balneolaceae bacterium]
MKSKKIEFENSRGDKLSARLDEPDSENANISLLFAHCFTCSKNLKAVGQISRALTEKGITVFRFDFTGLGQSEGDFADSTFSTDVKDLVAAANFMEQNEIPPGILMGHSLGGAAVLQAAGRIPSVKAVTTVGAPCNPDHVQHHMDHKLDEIQEKGEATVTLAGRPFKVRKEFLDDLKAQVMDETIRDLDKALLIFHSPADQIVGIDNAAHIYKLAKHPKSFISLDQADHLLTHEQDALYVGAVTAAWAERYFI